jgi:hypothetical protein
MTDTAMLRGSTALTSPEPRRDPLRPILVSGEGLAPDERERRRLELRREWAGRLIVMTRELTDALNPDNPLALSPVAFPWLEWSEAMHLTHSELRRPRYAYIFEDGVIAKAYSVDFLIRLRWVVELLRPLMLQENIVVPAFYQVGWTRFGGARELPAIHGDAVVPQVIDLSTRCANDADLAYCAIHELAHCDQLPGPDGRSAADAHGIEFRATFGRYLNWLLNGPGGTRVSKHEDRWIRSYAVEDSYAPPIHPGPGRGWQFDRDGRWVVCPHPVNDPPAWALEDW